jgi:hypothetical protein
VYTQWNGDVTSTVKAPVTELSFYSLPLTITDAQKADIIKDEAKLDQLAVKEGKAIAAATGHTIQTARGVQQPGEFFRSQLGWNSVQDSQAWRSSPAFTQAQNAVNADFQQNDFSIAPAPFPGINATTGSFHVKFTVGQ